MKIIDLLNKIANGEEVPKKIRITDIDDRITRHYNFFYDEDGQEYKDDELFPLGARLILDRVLNEKVEILEEEKKIPEKITMRAGIVGDINNKIENLDINQMAIEDKLNEIIDYFYYLKSKGDK
jgi:hypothetical protein